MPNYTIVESQTTNGATAVLKAVKTDFNTAEQEYHSRLSFAAVSAVDIHAVTLLNERGQLVEYKYFDHRQPETESAEE